HPDPFFLVPALLSPPIPILPRSNEKAQLLLDFFDRLTSSTLESVLLVLTIFYCLPDGYHMKAAARPFQVFCKHGLRKPISYPISSHESRAYRFRIL
ncbi:hypothetical protein ACTQ34_03205, partial [Agathobaculum sp. LCP25S3_E8]|uniref:hypothetical protein n=1 Tax=Agathobaculum sp. LCP25S3_E8 TaxID=3438735 RepID=UPI003F93F06F